MQLMCREYRRDPASTHLLLREAIVEKTVRRSIPIRVDDPFHGLRRALPHTLRRMSKGWRLVLTATEQPAGRRGRPDMRP